MLKAIEPWVNTELQLFLGNLVALEVELADGEPLTALSVYSPAWPVNPARLTGIDTTGVQLTQNRRVWVADLLWAALKASDLDTHSWLIGGDFNLSETFDSWPGGPRGNREYLDRMASLGLTECLRSQSDGLTPTFRNTDGGAIKHQMDHLFVTNALASRLASCAISPQEAVFATGLSDHLAIIADFRPASINSRTQPPPSALTLAAALEGGAVYTTERDGQFFVVIDESTTLSLLSNEDREGLSDGIQHLPFRSAAERDSYLRQRGWIGRL